MKCVNCQKEPFNAYDLFCRHCGHTRHKAFHECSGCGGTVLNEVTQTSNFNYCPYCGGKIGEAVEFKPMPGAPGTES